MEGQPQKKLLIVDDSELNRAILGELFKDQYEIVEAENGREAIDLLEKDHAQIAALLLDIVMPVLDGFGVLEFLAKSGYHNEIPVFLITAETSGAVRMRGYESGVVDVIAKPITDPNIRRQACEQRGGVVCGPQRLAADGEPTGKNHQGPG